MKVIKKINNNVALCLDSKNNEVIAFGKGIGFGKPPYEIELSQINRTYYGIDETYITMINDIPEEIIELSSRVIEYARMKLDNPISSNIVFTLADHINFAIKRYQENMNVKLPIIYDIQYLFDTEMDIGKKALSLIKDELKIDLPKEEAAYIALQIINAESMGKDQKSNALDEKIIEDITEIIENHFNTKIDKDGFNYSRFVTHLYYLLKRGKKNQLAKNENNSMYRSLVSTLPKIYECTQKIRAYLREKLQWELTDEECIYLILHINRLCDREGCYQ